MVIEDDTEKGLRDEVSETPKLSEAFYRKLLDLPSCVACGYCDNCGRCEH